MSRAIIGHCLSTGSEQNHLCPRTVLSQEVKAAQVLQRLLQAFLETCSSHCSTLMVNVSLDDNERMNGRTNERTYPV